MSTPHILSNKIATYAKKVLYKCCCKYFFYIIIVIIVLSLYCIPDILSILCCTFCYLQDLALCFLLWFGFLRDWFFNLGQNICRLFQFLAQFLFTTSETELDYYHWNVNIRVASRAANDVRLRILGNYEILTKFLKYLDLMASTQPTTLMPNFDVFGKQLQKINCKTFHRKTYFA